MTPRTRFCPYGPYQKCVRTKICFFGRTDRKNPGGFVSVDIFINWSKFSGKLRCSIILFYIFFHVLSMIFPTQADRRIDSTPDFNVSTLKLQVFFNAVIFRLFEKVIAGRNYDLLVHNLSLWYIDVKLTRP